MHMTRSLPAKSASAGGTSGDSPIPNWQQDYREGGASCPKILHSSPNLEDEWLHVLPTTTRRGTKMIGLETLDQDEPEQPVRRRT